MLKDNKKKSNKKTQSKEKKKEKRKEFWSKFWSKIWKGVVLFFKGLWKFIIGIFKYILFPFWYTGVLFVKTSKFLKKRGDQALTDEDKRYLSLIPTLFFMLSLCIVIIFLLFYLEFFDEVVDKITDVGFWAAVGQFFVTIAEGIWWLLGVIFVDFLWFMIIVPFGDTLQGHHWISALILLVGLILISGLSILLYNLAKTNNFMQKIGHGIAVTALFPKKVHNKIREDVVLKYLIGKKRIETRSKNFFWVTVFIQTLITFVFFIFAVVLLIYNYAKGIWTGIEVLEFSVYASLILFLFVGIFSTWFFNAVLGVSTKDSDRFTI